MAEIIFPQRTRCKKCRSKLDTVVLNGLFCSYKCASAPAPAKKPEDAPRGCRLQSRETGAWEWKKKYRYEAEVSQRFRDDPDTNIYLCEHCLFLHVGHSRPKEGAINKHVGDVAVLGRTLALARQQRGLDKKFVAAKLKTRPIRITEIEEGRDTMDITVVFKLAHFLGLKILLSG